MLKFIRILLIFSSFLNILAIGQQAILISSSIGYYNYRQTANILKVYHKLKQNGFSDNDILLMIPQNSGCCQKNPLYGSVSFFDNDYQNINHNVQIDYDFTDFNIERIFDIFRMQFNVYDINKVKLKSTQQPQPLFIYITGHGGNTYFKIRERQALIDENFKNIFNHLSSTQRFSKILLMSDSCSAITPYQNVDAQNFTAFGSSSFDQKSHSHGFDNLLNAPKSDDFTFYFMEYLEDNDPKTKPIYLKQLFNYMSFDKLGVHAKIVGKGKKKLKTINDFIIKRKKEIIKKKIKLQSILNFSNKI